MPQSVKRIEAGRTGGWGGEMGGWTDGRDGRADGRTGGRAGQAGRTHGRDPKPTLTQICADPKPTPCGASIPQLLQHANVGVRSETILMAS